MSEQSEISKFSGRYKFLSNFYAVNLYFEGLIYPSVEHAYQAAKARYEPDKERIRDLSTPGEAKRAGRVIFLRPDWEEIKLTVMETLVRSKFRRKTLRDKLLATGDTELIEGNWWGDKFWGVCNGVGQNHLGKILMKVRKELCIHYNTYKGDNAFWGDKAL